MTEPLTPQDPTHESLLHRLAQNPQVEAWEEFHGRYGQLITTYCKRTGLFGVDSEELLQEVFQALLKTLPSFQYVKAKGGFRAYLWRVVRNHALGLLKRQHASPMPMHAELESSLEETHDPDEVWEEEWRIHHLRCAFEQLSRGTAPAQMKIFQLYALEKQPVTEVAKLSECSVEMVYKIKSLLMERLAKIVKKQIELEG